MNFGQAKARLRTMCGNINTDNVSDVRVGEIIVEAENQISKEYAFREVRCIGGFQTVIGSPRYILPSNLWAIRKVWDATNNRPIKGPYSDATLANLPLRQNGDPRRYIRDRNWIHLDPPPKAVIIVKFTYTRKITPYTDDNAILTIPEDWHYLVCLRARWIYYTDNQDYPKAQNAWNTFELLAAKHPLPIEKELDERDVPAEFVELGSIRQRDLDFDHVDD